MFFFLFSCLKTLSKTSLLREANFSRSWKVGVVVGPSSEAVLFRGLSLGSDIVVAQYRCEFVSGVIRRQSEGGRPTAADVPTSCHANQYRRARTKAAAITDIQLLICLFCYYYFNPIKIGSYKSFVPLFQSSKSPEAATAPQRKEDVRLTHCQPKFWIDFDSIDQCIVRVDRHVSLNYLHFIIGLLHVL